MDCLLIQIYPLYDFFKSGLKIALGISAYDYNDAKKIIGKNSNEISKILGFEGQDEMVHKDNLVKFST